MTPRRPIRYAELGAALRRAREAVQPNLSGNALGARLRERRAGWSQSKVWLLEAGRQQPSEDDIRDWAAETGADVNELLEVRERALVRRLDIRQAARLPGGVEALQGDLAALEAGSTTIAEYQIDVIPGLAQTADYTRAWLNQPDRVELGGPVNLDEALMRRAARQRQARDRAVTVAVRPSALTAVYGAVDVQRGQLDALADAAEQGELELLIAEQPLAILGGFELLDDVVVLETVHGAHIMAEATVVQQFRAALERVRRQGLSGASAARRVRDAQARMIAEE